MRILALTNLYPTPFQPFRAPFNRQQLGALSMRHELAIIAPIAWTDELALRRRGGAPLPASRGVTSEGITVHHPRYLFPPKIFRGWYGHFLCRSIRPAFRQAIEELKPDVLLAAWAFPDGWAAVQLAREAGIPVAIKVLGSDILLLRPNSARQRRTIEALRGADGVIAVSQDLRDHVVALGVAADKVSVVYSGVNTSLFHPAPRRDARARLGIVGSTPLLLYVGNLAAVKRLDVLVDACAFLHQKGLQFDCRMIGQGPMKGSLERQIRASGLQDHMSLMAPRPMEELPDWYRAADVFVLPSRSEGLPNVLLEAMACGTPIVATRVGGVPEITRGLRPGLVPSGDPQALADAIARTLTGAGAATAEGFHATSWDDSARLLAEVLQGLMSAIPTAAPLPAIAA